MSTLIIKLYIQSHNEIFAYHVTMQWLHRLYTLHNPTKVCYNRETEDNLSIILYFTDFFFSRDCDITLINNIFKCKDTVV